MIPNLTKQNGCTFLDFVIDLGLEPDREVSLAYRIVRRCREYISNIHLEFPNSSIHYNCKNILEALNIPLFHKKKARICAEGEDKEADEIITWMYFNLTSGGRAS